MIHGGFVVLVDRLAELDERVTDEEVSDVRGDLVVETCERQRAAPVPIGRTYRAQAVVAGHCCP